MTSRGKDRTSTWSLSTRPHAPLKEARGSGILSLFLAISAGVLMIVAAVYTFQVLTNFRDITSEASDNVEWSLAQVELETRDFTAALEAAALDPDNNLDRVRLRFDILYSRIITIAAAPVYQRLEVMPEFKAALDRVHTFILSAVLVVDSSDSDLRAALPLLIEQSAHLRNDTRTLSLSGLTFFAEQSDEKRARVTQTLLRLAAIAALLIAALVTLLLHALRINRKFREHGEELAQANTRMNTILTTSLDGVIVVDNDGLVLEFNSAAEEIFQYKSDDIRGHPILDLISPDDMRDIHQAAMQRALDGGEDHIVGEGRVRLQAKRADGTEFPIEIAAQFAEENNRPIFIGFLHDISKRVAAEKELLEARDRALAGERAKAEFLTVMSHEIRTPLNGILGNVSLLNDTQLTPTQTRHIRNMEISGRVLMRHVDTVLDIARFEAGKLDVSIACTDLSVLMQELVDSQLSAANAQNTSLSWRWEGEPRAWVRTDRAAVEQVLLNLVGNAIKFTRNGSITIEAEALPEEKDGVPLVELRVLDTGLGIAQNRLSEIFEDFITNDTDFGRVPGGTGLGLGIAKRTVTAMGGEIGVESTLGEGSVFWIRLPMEAGRRPDQMPDITQPQPIAHLHMLVVEDNDINRELAKDMLQHEGHWVTTAVNGAEGVRLAQDTLFDVILMDISMPVMDGLAATQAIRTGEGANKETPIIAVSANILPEERSHLLDAGITAFLAKPLNRERLRRALTSVSEDIPDQENDPHLSHPGLPPATYSRLLARFIEEADALVAAITAPYRDASDVAKRCHDLAGAAALFGATDMHEFLSEADSAAKRKDANSFEKQVTKIPPRWQTLRPGLVEKLPPNAAE